jgi:NDP-sugar pyrophosphorylase family protein
MTGVHPSSRFGEFSVDGNRITQFNEKPQTKEGLINGGYFVFKKSSSATWTVMTAAYWRKSRLRGWPETES